MKLVKFSTASSVALAAAMMAATAVAKNDVQEQENGDRAHVYRPGPDLGVVTSVENVATPTPQEFNLDDYAGQVFRNKPIFDLNGVVGQIDSGARDKVNAGTITFTFLKGDHLTGIFNNPNYGFTAGNGVGPLSEDQRTQARASVQLWDDLVAHRFVELNGQGADIRFANSADPAQAYAYYPNASSGLKIFGDVFLADPALNWTNNWLGFNGYGRTTVIHELGHSQGMSHPGAYNFAPGIPLNYVGLAEYAQDSEQYSIMSYWNPEETLASLVDWNTFLFGNVQTPMLHDIYVVQSMYGADPNTRSGDTVYGFNSTADRDVFDFSQNSVPGVAIYDAGGNDTFDLSGFNAGVHIDLHDGSFSSGAQAVPDAATISANRAALTVIAAGAQVFGPVSQATVDAVSASYIANNELNIFFDSGVSGVNATALYNLAIAYGTVIENAKGGSARDLLWGNEGDNVLTGNGGDDVIDGYEGADTYVGGAGNDTYLFSHLESGDEIEDFLTAEDTIDLTGTGVSFTYVGNAAFTNTAGELRYDGGVLMGDADGDGSADISIDLHNATLAVGDLNL